MPKAVVILADGFEEIEAVTQIDVLRRAGVAVTVAGLDKSPAKGAHGIMIETDATLYSLGDDFDAVILPGGMPGSESLGESDAVVGLLKKQRESGRIIAAICAAPAFAPVRAGVLDGKRATCYPSFESRFGDKTTFSEERVVIDGNIVTSRGPGTALEMALALVSELVSPEKAAEIKNGMLIR